jgi:hypothetical protein
VKEIVKTAGEKQLQFIERNVAQFSSEHDLVSALHHVRDVALSGKTPVLFLDEFDSPKEGTPLGWLKWFLAPMQDGQFRHQSGIHDLGKVIFVFAGGTRETMADFAGQKSAGNFDVAAAKLPDFTSRILAALDIRGVQLKPNSSPEPTMITRALLFRSLLERHQQQLFGPGKILVVEDRLIQRLKSWHFNHGARSLEALVRMLDLPPSPGPLSIHHFPEERQRELHALDKAPRVPIVRSRRPYRRPQ